MTSPRLPAKTEAEAESAMWQVGDAIIFIRKRMLSRNPSVREEANRVRVDLLPMYEEADSALLRGDWAEAYRLAGLMLARVAEVRT